MNIFRERWTKFKQELFPILYLSIIQIWLNFNFPAFVRLGNSWNIVFSLSLSVATTFFYMYILSYPDRYIALFNIEHLDDAPELYRDILKDLHRAGLWLTILFAMFYMWYTNFYNMSNIWYILLYGHWVLAFMLIARAINRPKKMDGQ